MSLNLVVYRGQYNINLVWEVESKYYSINNLQKYQPIIQNIKWTIPIDPSRFTSMPAFIFTDTEWVILMVQNNNVVIYDQMSPQSIDQGVMSTFEFSTIPDISHYNSQADVLDSLELPRLMINPLDQDGRPILIEGYPLSTSVPPLQRIISEEEIIIEHGVPALYEVLLRQLYNLPVTLPDNFVSFEQISQMLSSNQIERYILDPELQPYAGHPASPNRILTMFDRNGTTYLVKARYDQATNQIFSPV